MADFIDTLRKEFQRDPDGGFHGLTDDELSLDDLTGFFQRKVWMIDCTHTLAHAKREGEKVAIMFLDVNNLKKVNDTKPWGSHDLGDKYIKTVSNVLKENVREEDIIGRFGGDEFVVFLPQATSDNAKIVEERIKSHLDDVLKSSSDFEAVPSEIKLGVSIGFSFWNGVDSLDKLIQDADKSMYQDKEKTKKSMGTRPINTYMAE